MQDFRQRLYEAFLVAFGKVLSKYNTFAQGSILRDVGREIIDYLKKYGFEFEEKGDLSDLAMLTDLFVKNGFTEKLEILPAKKGQNYIWHNLYGIEAYKELHEITDNPFLACPLNLCLYYLADKHNKTMLLHSKSFDSQNNIAQSQYEIVDKDRSGGGEFDALVIENVRLYELAQERAEKLEKAQLIRQRMEVELQQANTQLQEMLAETKQHQAEIDLVNQMLGLLQSCVTVQEAYPIVARFAQELFPGWAGALFILASEHNFLEAASVWGERLQGEMVFGAGDCWAIRRALAHDSTQNMVCGHLADHPPGSYLCIPLNALGETLGVLNLQAPGEPAAALPDNLKSLAVNLGNHVALALANIRLRETLRYQALHDPLTGLFNRRYLDETLKREIARVQRKNVALGIIMMDLDYFKRFNDIHGHEAGDDLLRALGNFLHRQIRQEDIACRYGGEEFVLVMPEAYLDAVRTRAEEIRQGVPRLQVFRQGQLVEGTTLSLGLAMFPMHGATGETVLRAADDAMYQAKVQGRNRLVIAAAGDPAANGSPSG